MKEAEHEFLAGEPAGRPSLRLAFLVAQCDGGVGYGACVLHVAPESYIGGPLALVQSGDMVAVEVDKRLI